MTKLERQSLWKTRISEFKASGLSIQVWCANQDVKPYQLWYWLRKDRDVSSSEHGLSWLPLDLSDDGVQPTLLVRIGRVAIEVKHGFDPKLLLDVVNTLVQ